MHLPWGPILSRRFVFDSNCRRGGAAPPTGAARRGRSRSRGRAASQNRGRSAQRGRNGK